MCNMHVYGKRFKQIESDMTRRGLKTKIITSIWTRADITMKTHWVWQIKATVRFLIGMNAKTNFRETTEVKRYLPRTSDLKVPSFQARGFYHEKSLWWQIRINFWLLKCSNVKQTSKRLTNDNCNGKIPTPRVNDAGWKSCVSKVFCFVFVIVISLDGALRDRGVAM